MSFSPYEIREIFQAIANKDMSLLRGWIGRGFDPKTRGEGGRTALMEAASVCWPDGVEFLLPLSDPLAVDAARRSALMHGAARGDAKVADLLVPASDLAQADANAATAAQMAIAGARFEYARRVLPVSDPNQRASKGRSLLMLAAHAGDEKMIRLVLAQYGENGAKNAAGEVDELGQTALLCAARNGNDSGVRVLLPISNPQIATLEGDTALILAARKGRPSCVRLLLDALPQEALAVSNGHGTAIDAALSYGHDALGDEMGLRASSQEQGALLQRWAGAVELPKTRAAFEQAELAGILRQDASSAERSPKKNALRI